MYAIIESGAKQYKIKEGDIIEIELLKEFLEKKLSKKEPSKMDLSKKDLLEKDSSSKEQSKKEPSKKEPSKMEPSEMETPQNINIDFKNVILFKDEKITKIGTPYVKDCIVKAEIISEIKGPKVIAFKYKRRKNYRRKKGHRQKYLKVKIKKIKNGT